MSKLTMKEAGRYSNFLRSIIESLEELSITGMDSKIIKITTTHLKSKAKPELKDEVIVEDFNDDIKIKGFDLNDIDNLISELIYEKVSLTDAINLAKKDIVIKVPTYDYTLGLDAAIEFAKLKREKSNSFYGNLKSLENEKYTSSDIGYTFNIEGNQTSFQYNTIIEKELLFDKSNINKKDKEINLIADKVSDLIDQKMSEKIVAFLPKYSYLDSLSDLIEEYII